MQPSFRHIDESIDGCAFLLNSAADSAAQHAAFPAQRHIPNSATDSAIMDHIILNLRAPASSITLEGGGLRLPAMLIQQLIQPYRMLNRQLP